MRTSDDQAGPPTSLERLKDRLRQARWKRGWTMAGLEHKAGIKHTTVSQALNGASIPSEATVLLLAKALGEDPRPLLELRRQAMQESRSAATARSALDTVGGLDTALGSPADNVRRAALDRLFADLEAVHGDYLVMFESILEQAPYAWESHTPGFEKCVRQTAALLRRLRLVYEPVRVRVHATANVFDGACLPQPESAFVAAVLAYFPTGELRVDGQVPVPRTSGGAVLDHLYRSLDGELGQELGSLVRETLAFHRERWSGVCQAHAAMELSQGLPG